MDNSQQVYKVGDRVLYVGGQPEDEAPGTVSHVEAHTVYTYVVDWDDGDATDSYPSDRLAPLDPDRDYANPDVFDITMDIIRRAFLN